MGTAIYWINKQPLIVLPSETIRIHGGLNGIRDEGLLDSALARPLNVNVYENETNIFRLAAVYGIGIAKNNAYLDGKKEQPF